MAKPLTWLRRLFLYNDRMSKNIKVCFIGDVHGKIKQYKRITKSHERTLQLGDFGIGFVHDSAIPDYGDNHRAIRGNHDNPHKAKEHPLFLPDASMWNGIFVLGGAASPEFDRRYRVPGVSWWPEEELSAAELQQAIEFYEEKRPKIVASHDCPQIVFESICCLDRCPTRVAMQLMFEAHQPELWVFGHHHKHIDMRLSPSGNVKGETRFLCLEELEIYDVTYPAEYAV